MRPSQRDFDDGLSQIYPDRVPSGFIRVMELEPDNEESHITCNLQTISLLDAKDSYEAISYVWGNIHDQTVISCNGYSHHIPASLAGALKTIRRGATERKRLWADSICINQTDEQEKGHQITQMRMVFESAQRVIVCLGPDPEDIAPSCFELTKAFNRHWGHGMNAHIDPLKIPLKQPFPFKEDPQRWEEIKKMFEKPWFNRLWVVQEAGLAKSCSVTWGHSALEFDEVLELVQWLRVRADYSLQVCPNVELKWADIFIQNLSAFGNTATWRMNMPLSAWFNRKAPPTSHNGSFIDVLRTGRKLQATDARDRVYGFLGSELAITADGAMIVKPDYAKAVQDVYLDLGHALLRHPREAPFMLGAVDHSEPGHVRAEKGYPSWVPRWDQGYSTVPLAVPYNWYFAGGRDRVFTADVIQPGNLLSTKSVKFDRLSWVSETISKNNFSVDIDNWDEPFRTRGESPIDNLWAAILCSCACPRDDLEDIFMITLSREYPSSSAVQTEGINISWVRTEFENYRRRLRREVTASRNLQHFQQSKARVVRGGSSGSLRPIRFSNKISACHNRRLAHTENGRLVLTPRFAEPGDICCIFPGASVPYVLRKSEREEIYYLVGDCYIYGVMRGELIRGMEEGLFELESIVLE